MKHVCMYGFFLRSTCEDLGDILLQQYYEQCVMDVYYSGNQEAAQKALITFADYCQFVLDLDQWPAQSLCNQFEFEFPDWIGSVCDVPCYFGRRESNNIESCICRDGYWGKSCDRECPGGSALPCSGMGTCTQDQGTCNCPDNRLGSEDCSECSSGWYGEDCLVTYSQPQGSQDKIIGLLSHTSLVHTVHGLGFRVLNTGQYYLLNLNPYIIIQGKLIRCHTTFACMTFLGIRLGDPTYGYATVSLDAVNSDKVGVMINQKKTALDSTLHFQGFSIERKSYSEVDITVGSKSRIAIKAHGPYLSLEVIMPREFIPLTDGLLSGTNTTTASGAIHYLLDHSGYSESLDLSRNGTAIQEPLQNAINYDLPLNLSQPVEKIGSENNFTLSEIYLSQYVELWAVENCDVLIIYPSKEHELQRGGGFALRFNGGAAYSSVFDTSDIIGGEFTIEMMINTNKSSGGTVFSFANSHVFAMLYENDSLWFIHDDERHATDLGLENNTWNKVVLSYDSDLQQLNIYRFDALGRVQRSLLLPSLNIFNEPATLTLGEWQPPANGHSHHIPGSFQGYIDSFHVWSVAVEPTLIQDVWQMSVTTASPLLTAAWQFDEGESDESVDVQLGYMINLPPGPWLTPHWVPSHAQTDNEFTNPQQVLTYTFHSPIEQDESTAWCQAAVSHIRSVCNNLTDAVATLYEISCVQTAAMNTGSKRRMYSVVYSLADLCYTEWDLSQWPGTSLCPEDHASNPRPGTECPSPCLYGKMREDGGCGCDHGYTGPDCSEICPVGSQYPCNNHGQCVSATECLCRANWNGDPDCSSCGRDWYGEDCHIHAANSSIDNSTASISPTGIIQTCDQALFTTRNLAGVFTLFYSHANTIEIQVHMVQCEYGSCVGAVAISAYNRTITVHYNIQTRRFLLYMNGERFTVSQKITEIGSHRFVMEIYTPREIAFAVNGIQGNLTLRVHLMKQFFQVIIDTDTSLCLGSIGLLGNCDMNVDNDIPGDKGNISLVKLQSELTNLHKVAISESLFSESGDGVPALNTAPGFTLSFNGTAGRSQPLTYVFEENQNRVKRTTTAGNDITVSLLVRARELGGVVFSYGKENTFALYNDNNLTLVCSDEVAETDFQLSYTEWSHLIIGLDSVNYRLHMYHFTETGAISYQVMETKCLDLMQPGGRLTLGDWQPAPDGEQRIVEPFKGEIEEFSVWVSRLPHTILYQMFHLDIKPALFQDSVAYLYKFSEGVGYTAHELMESSDIGLPASPWPHPNWRKSTLHLQDLPHSSIHDTEISEEILTMCKYFFSDSTGDTCKVPLGHAMQIFELECSRMASREGAFYTMLAFSYLCQDIDLSRLCALDGRPFWVDAFCQPCQFGVQEKENCTCMIGYWGEHCTEVCPGGLESPCNNNGYCSVEGVCYCNPHYTGKSCETYVCMDGWIGEDCALWTGIPPMHGSGIWRVAQVQSGGRVTTLDGSTFYLQTTGIYSLLNTSNLSVLTRLVKMQYLGLDPGLSFDSIMLGWDDEYMFINTSSTHENEFVIWTESSTLHIITFASFSGLEFRRVSPNSINVSLPGQDLHLTIMINLDGIYLTIASKPDTWVAYKGLLMTCNMSRSVEMVQCPELYNCLNYEPEGDCLVPVTENYLNIYVVRFIINSPLYVQFAGPDVILSPKQGMCLYYEGNSMYSSKLNVPSDRLTMNFYIKPLGHGGVILCYQGVENFVLVLTTDGLKISSGDIYINTGLHLQLDNWNEINLYWDMLTSLLELYVSLPNGETRIVAFTMREGLFSNIGILTIGETGEGIVLPTDPGIFKGFIDDLRIWTRPHNPSIVTRAANHPVTYLSSDLELWWDFSEGTGLSSTERLTGLALNATSAFNPPVWVTSDLDTHLISQVPVGLQDDTRIGLPLDSAVKMCMQALNNSHVNQICSSMPVNYSYLFLQDCIQAVVISGQADNADWVMAQYIALCVASQQLPMSPTSGSACVFGHYTDENSCECQYGFWGSYCHLACPTPASGAVCSNHGYCVPHVGSCHCFPHWQHSKSFELGNFTSLYEALDDRQYTCSSCSFGWYGTDCGIAVVGDLQVRALSVHVAVVVRHLVTILDGAVVEMVLPGRYQLLAWNDVSVHVLMTSYSGNHLTRSIQEVSVSIASTTVSVQSVNATITVWITEDNGFSLSEIIHTDVKDNVYSVGAISFRWHLDSHIRFYLSDKVEVLVSCLNGELMCGVEVPHGMPGIAGLVGSGSANGSWIDSLNFGLPNSPDSNLPNDVLLSTLLSVPYAAAGLKKEFGLDADASHLYHKFALHDPSSAGYMLRLHAVHLTFPAPPYYIALKEFTLSLWIKVHIHSMMERDIRLVQVNLGDSAVDLALRGNTLILHWGESEVINSGVKITLGSWNHVSLCWKAGSGRLNLYVWNAMGLTNFTHYMTLGMHDYSFRDITIGNHLDVQTDFDYVRIYSFSQPVSVIMNHLYSYKSGNVDDAEPGLIWLALMDEGQGQDVVAHLYNNHGISGSVVARLPVNVADIPQWLPSDIPVYDILTPGELPLHISQDQLKDCMNITFSAPVMDHCGNLSSVLQMYLESCLRDLTYGVPVTSVTAYAAALTFYCRGMQDIDECDLEGHLDYCIQIPDEPPIWIWIVIVCLSVVIICVCCVVIWICVKKKKKKKKERYVHPDINLDAIPSKPPLPAPAPPSTTHFSTEGIEQRRNKFNLTTFTVGGMQGLTDIEQIQEPQQQNFTKVLEELSTVRQGSSSTIEVSSESGSRPQTVGSVHIGLDTLHGHDRSHMDKDQGCPSAKQPKLSRKKKIQPLDDTSANQDIGITHLRKDTIDQMTAGEVQQAMENVMYERERTTEFEALPDGLNADSGEERKAYISPVPNTTMNVKPGDAMMAVSRYAGELVRDHRGSSSTESDCHERASSASTPIDRPSSGDSGLGGSRPASQSRISRR